MTGHDTMRRRGEAHRDQDPPLFGVRRADRRPGATLRSLPRADLAEAA
jgi:hypothetical protein